MIYPNIRANLSIVLLTWKRAKRFMVKSTIFNDLDTMRVLPAKSTKPMTLPEIIAFNAMSFRFCLN
jgi:hypothetical protein